MELDFDACYRAFSARDVRFDGRVFVGVHTTGIYCRPICPARTPKRENVSYYPSAAAAQRAGFRPCLRCRPEISPDVSAWSGSSETVTRALALIEAGALDDGSVDDLAERVGVCGRQLRRLFEQHLGASPVAVAQTRRVHLAKHLIHETDLSMADVALASGFGSIRRFNETFQQLFHRPPASLRRTKGEGAPNAAAVTVRLAYRPPYDWDGMIDFLAPRAIPGVESVTRERYARTITLDGVSGSLVVEPGLKNTLRVTVRFPELGALPRIIARVRRMFDLAADPTLIEAHLSEDHFLAPLVSARPGLRIPGSWDGFELAVRAMLGQQITVPAATKLAGRLAAEYGVPFDDPVARALGLTHLFPLPEQLAEREIATLGLMPGARAAGLSSLAREAIANPDLFGSSHDLESAVARLDALPGVGAWTANYIAMRALQESDAFPAADIGLLRAMTDVSGRRPTPRELLARADAWRPWRAYAAMHLWASLAIPPAALPDRKDGESRAA